MKRLLLFIALASVAHAAGSVQQNIQNIGGNVYAFSFNWIGDSVTGSVPATTAQGSLALQGYRVISMETTPGSPAPTNGYSITLIDNAGVDIMANAAISLSSSTAQSFAGSPTAPPLYGSFVFTLTGNSVASAKGSAVVYLAPLNQVLGLSPTTPNFPAQGADLFYSSPCGSSGSPGFRAPCITDFTPIGQGVGDSKLQLAGTNSGVAGASICNDANGGTTTSGCTPALPAGTQLQYLRVQPNTGNNTTVQFASLPQINMNDYNYPSYSCNVALTCVQGGTSAGSLAIGNNTLIMNPVPLGMNGSDTGHYIWVSGGTGAAEGCLITGGTGVSQQANGQIIINCANTHSGAFTLQTANAGCGEATAATPNGAAILMGIGTFLFNSSCNFGPFHQFLGASRGFLNSGQGTVVDARTVPTTLAAFQYLSPIMGGGYDVDSGIRFQDISMECFRCILINQESLPANQGNIKNVVLYHIRMNGTYASASDPNRFSNVIPTLTTLRTFGELFSCSQCFDADLFNLEIENGGIGVFFQVSDINTIEGSTRFQTNAVNVWIDGTGLGGEGAGTNKIINNDILGNQRIPSIMANGVINLSVFNNYFEEYCPSAQFLRSVGSFGVRFISNRIDDPANAGLCVASGGPNTTSTTPILHLEDFNSDMVTGNYLNIGSSNIPPLEIAYTNWNSARPNFVSCTGNNQFFPCPDGQFQIPTGVFYALAPGVVSTPALNPYLVKPSNVASDVVTGACSTSFAAVWHQSAVLKQADNATFRWVMNTGTCAFTFKLQNQEFTNYLFQFTGRKIGTGAGAFTIQYTDAAGTLTTLQSSNLNFIATTEVETRDVQVQLPSTAVGPGKFTLIMDGSNAEIEQIEVIPQPGGNQPVLSGCTFSAQTGGPFTGGYTGSYTSGTTGACTVTFTFNAIARNGWVCKANDITTPADVQNQTTVSATAATISGTTVSGDLVNFMCLPY